MVPPTPTPSSRLLRAATAEREDLRRHRQRLLDARETLRAELARLDASLEAVQEREALLERLTGPPGHEPSSPPAAVPGAGVPPTGPHAPTPLRGPAIRRAAVEALLAHPDRPEALHYREWFELLGRAGLAVAGKDPLAVFLTQLSRSPVVRKGTQSGVYELDRAAPGRLRAQLDRLHEELRRLAAPPPDGATDLTAVRARRAELHAQIGQVEKALEEAEAALAPTSRDQPLARAG
jgi:uncharacterized protein YhaN